MAAACAEKAGGSGTGCLVAMPTQGLCELGKLAGNTTAARASARPLGERAPRRAEGGVQRRQRSARGARGAGPRAARSRAGSRARGPDRGAPRAPRGTVDAAPPAPTRSQLHRQIAPVGRFKGLLPPRSALAGQVLASDLFAAAFWLWGLISSSCLHRPI